MIAARRAPRSLAGPIGASAVLHAAIILPLLLLHQAAGATHAADVQGPSSSRRRRASAPRES